MKHHLLIAGAVCFLLVICTLVLIREPAEGKPLQDGAVDCLPAVPDPVAPGTAGRLFLQLHPRNYPTIPVSKARRGPHVVVKRGVNICDNYEGKRLIAVIEEPYLTTLNETLTGKDYPVTKALLSILASGVSPVAGVVSSVMSAALSSCRRAPFTLAREGDELWRLDILGTDGNGKATYVTYIVLNDPYRNQQWILEEKRCPVKFEED
jgi:hypothetical protein